VAALISVLNNFCVLPASVLMNNLHVFPAILFPSLANFTQRFHTYLDCELNYLLEQRIFGIGINVVCDLQCTFTPWH
jgi:hypothetical protein